MRVGAQRRLHGFDVKRRRRDIKIGFATSLIGFATSLIGFATSSAKPGTRLPADIGNKYSLPGGTES